MGPIQEILQRELAEKQCRLEQGAAAARFGAQRRLSARAAEAPSRPGGQRMSLPVRTPGLEHSIDSSSSAASTSGHGPARGLPRRPSVRACREGLGPVTPERRRDLEPDVSQTASPADPAESARYWEDFHARNEAFLAQRERAKEALRSLTEESQFGSCTFEPQILPQSIAMVRSARLTSARSQGHLDLARETKRNERRSALLKEHDERCMSECSFAPDRRPPSRRRSEPETKLPSPGSFSDRASGSTSACASGSVGARASGSLSARAGVASGCRYGYARARGNSYAGASANNQTGLAGEGEAGSSVSSRGPGSRSSGGSYVLERGAGSLLPGVLTSARPLSVGRRASEPAGPGDTGLQEADAAAKIATRPESPGGQSRRGSSIAARGAPTEVARSAANRSQQTSRGTEEVGGWSWQLVADEWGLADDEVAEISALGAGTAPVAASLAFEVEEASLAESPAFGVGTAPSGLCCLGVVPPTFLKRNGSTTFPGLKRSSSATSATTSPLHTQTVDEESDGLASTFSQALWSTASPSLKPGTSYSCSADQGEEADQDGAVVWFPLTNAEEWSPCKLLARSPYKGLKLQAPSGALRWVAPEEAHLACPALSAAPPPVDLAALPRDGLGAEAVERALREHFCAGLPYTHVGEVTLLVNPLRELPIYGDEWVEKYATLRADLPPHIFEIAAKAYKHAVEDEASQTVILLGESGGGKSASLRQLLHFWQQTASNEDIDEQVRALLPALLPLVSVPCLAGKVSWSSTRALLSVEIGLDDDGFMRDCMASVFLLEAGRLLWSERLEGPSFEALHLARGAPCARAWLGERDDFVLLGHFADTEDLDPLGEASATWTAALEALGFDVQAVVRALCGLLLLAEVLLGGRRGCSSPSSATTASSPCSQGEDDEAAAARALGVEPSELAGALAGFVGDDAAAAAALEDVYRRLVAWAFEAANKRMCSASAADSGHTGVDSASVLGTKLSAIEVPAFPAEGAGVDAPFGLDAVQLQLLTEGTRADILAGALASRPLLAAVERPAAAAAPSPGRIAGGRDSTAVGFSQRQQVAEAAVDELSGFLAALRPPKAVNAFDDARGCPQAGEQERELQARAALVDRWFSECQKVSGAAGVVEHSLASRDLHMQRAIYMGATTIAPLLATLALSSFAVVAALAVTTPVPAGPSAAESVVNQVRQTLCGEDGVRPWLVCCMRPNDSATPTCISRPVLLRQVRSLLLPEVVHLAADPHYCIVWSLRDFNGRYGCLLPDRVAGSGDAEACRLLMEAFAERGDGTVGAEDVFGTQGLLFRLDAALSANF